MVAQHTEDGPEPIPPEVREQIFKEAEGASSLLDNPHLASVMEELKWSHLNAFASSKPSELNVREDAYQAIRSLIAIRQLLEHRVNRARLIAAEEEEENNPSHDDE